jgi:hypothetical protein
MGKVYHHTLQVPVEYQYDKSRIVAISSLPSVLDVQVEGRGWDIARAIWWDKKPVRIRINKPLEAEYLLPSQWENKTREVLTEVKVEKIGTDTIFCRFDPIEKKQVGLYVDLQDIRLRMGYQISSPIRLTPRFVEFRGAASLIRNLPAMLPVRVDARNISESFDQNVGLDFSEEYPKNQLLNYDLDKVNVQFTVRPSLEESLDIPIEMVNARSGLGLKETKATVTFLVSDSEKPELRLNAFRVVADMATFNPADSTVEVRLEKYPETVSDVQVGIKKTRVYVR